LNRDQSQGSSNDVYSKYRSARKKNPINVHVEQKEPIRDEIIEFKNQCKRQNERGQFDIGPQKQSQSRSQDPATAKKTSTEQFFAALCP